LPVVATLTIYNAIIIVKRSKVR